jgi:tRNA(Arg) A34 adenosine deaminase TadA
MTHDDFINLAIEYAKEAASNGGYPFGAIVVKNGEVAGDSRRGFLKHAGYINHAELRAIINACDNLKSDDLEGSVLYSSCQPCGLCMGAIKWVGIKEIYFAMDKGDAKSIGHFGGMFADEVTDIKEHKIADSELLKYMKNWYDKKATG